MMPRLFIVFTALMALSNSFTTAHGAQPNNLPSPHTVKIDWMDENKSSYIEFDQPFSVNWIEPKYNLELCTTNDPSTSMSQAVFLSPDRGGIKYYTLKMDGIPAMIESYSRYGCGDIDHPGNMYCYHFTKIFFNSLQECTQNVINKTTVQKITMTLDGYPYRGSVGLPANRQSLQLEWSPVSDKFKAYSIFGRAQTKLIGQGKVLTWY